MKIDIKKVNMFAEMPKYQHEDDACADLVACEFVKIDPGKVAVIDTGIVFDIPKGWELQVRSRSGLAANSGIAIPNGIGIIDAGFRSSVKVILFNFGDEPYRVIPGDRIAQASLQRVYKMEFEEVDTLSETERGKGGLGSTGV